MTTTTYEQFIPTAIDTCKEMIELDLINFTLDTQTKTVADLSEPRVQAMIDETAKTIYEGLVAEINPHLPPKE